MKKGFGYYLGYGLCMLLVASVVAVIVAGAIALVRLLIF